MSPSVQLVVFTLDEQPYALELASVHRVVRALEVTPLSGVPAVILGVINVQGELMPVVSLRHRFRLPEREIGLSDQFIIANMTQPNKPIQGATGGTTRRVALVVDAVTAVDVVAQESIVAGDEVVADLEYVQGIAKIASDLILIHNLERCLSLNEAKMLDDALVKIGT